MEVFVLDNYDSFTFNLVQYLGALGAGVEVRRSDQVTLRDVAEASPDAIVISPGPGGPRDAGISMALVEWCVRTATPLLGVCLGHQAIAAALGGTIVPAPEVMHGKTSEIHHDADGVLRDLPSPFVATRYHSLVVDRATLPTPLSVTAWTGDGQIMGIRHVDRPVEGVQFHPEAILTEHGMTLIWNFLSKAEATVTVR